MKKILFTMSVILCFMNMQCEDDDYINTELDNLLIGSWENPIYNGEEITFSRTSALPEAGYGISFKGNRSFIERSSGWCGTPPLVFSDYHGEWQLDNMLITITQDHFPNNYAWRVVSLTANELVVKRALTDQEKDHQKLIALFDEIYNFQFSVSCTNASDWTFTAYGSKACGGPQGYMAYPSQTDTVVFLQKIEEYKKMEKEYNIKWKIVSTCDLPNQPKGVTCANGYPVFKY